MSKLAWDVSGERLYEAGVDKGVLFIPDDTGAYANGFAWNGLTDVTEAPTGAAATPQYADNTKYLNLISTEFFAGTIGAFTYPDEFGQCDGTDEPQPGVRIGQQSRKTFGLCYRTKVGNDLAGTDHGYKLHLVYGLTAAPTSKAYTTINDQPAAIAFSWAIESIPVAVTGLKPTSLIVVDSTIVGADELTTLENALYGTDGTDPYLPLPDDVVAMFAGEVTMVRLVGANAPAYNAGTHVLTLPAVTGVSWFINGVRKDPGAQPALADGDTAVITAQANAGYEITGDNDWTYDF
jgi:hypothetical protein